MAMGNLPGTSGKLATGHRSTEADHGAEAKGPIMSF